MESPRGMMRTPPFDSAPAAQPAHTSVAYTASPATRLASRRAVLVMGTSALLRVGRAGRGVETTEPVRRGRCRRPHPPEPYGPSTGAENRREAEPTRP